VVAAAPELLEVESFADLGPVADPAAALANPAHARWRSLRDRLDSRFLAVALPRVLARPPWPDDGTRGDGFRYRERTTAVTDRLWMSGGYAFAAVVARAAARFGWPADVRGADPDRVGGGLVTDLPMELHRLSQTLSLPRLPVEVVFTDRQERTLIEAGLMPLGALPYGEELLFGSVRSLYRPPRLAGPAAQAATANTRMAAQMNATLCASRFAHYLKIRGRHTVGRVRRPEEIERELRAWLTGFINRNTQATAETRATHPLYDANVSVLELPDKPGAFTCKIMLQPYFQLDDVTANFHFETEITPPAA
jgi:type VI secretion system protein ImpD/type VI secretion system protein ImpC